MVKKLEENYKNRMIKLYVEADTSMCSQILRIDVEKSYIFQESAIKLTVCEQCADLYRLRC